MKYALDIKYIHTSIFKTSSGIEIDGIKWFFPLKNSPSILIVVAFLDLKLRRWPWLHIMIQKRACFYIV